MPASSTPPDLLFYDGTCGLCHRAVRFALWADSAGDRFRYAPLDSQAFRSIVPESERATLPDSLVVRTSQGAVHTRSAAVLHVLKRSGGLWAALAAALRVIPRSWRDAGYDFAARRRRRWFRRPADACPIVPKHLRSRFL